MISRSLIDKAMRYYTNYSKQSFVVSPSLPVLYFGDLEAYSRSPLRIITVGKNPSAREFDRDKKGRFERFPRWTGKSNSLVCSLNEYFRVNPYMEWFRPSFSRILEGMDASFCGAKTNTALHTDLCSPLGTDPGWSGLCSAQMALLEEEGEALWRSLVDELRPQVMLVSVPLKLYEKSFGDETKELIRFVNKKDGSPRENPYIVYQSIYEFDDGETARVIYGQAAQTPFGTIDAVRQFKIGEAACLV